MALFCVVLMLLLLCCVGDGEEKKKKQNMEGKERQKTKGMKRTVELCKLSLSPSAK